MPKQRTSSNRRHIVFGWYGGKFNHLDWLLPLLPACHHYCEPFAGSAAVLLNREPAPVETYNDIDGEVVNFFRVLRDEKDHLVEAIGLTPFAREEFYRALTPSAVPLSDLERARRFFIRARQVRTGLAQTATLGRWANCKNTSRAGMSGVVSRWLGSVRMLPEVAERLLRVQIENRPALEVIRLYDSCETLFYCLHPSVLVRTEDEAMVPVSDLEEGMRLAHGKTIEGVYRREHHGSMLEISIQGLPDTLCVTPEHRIPRIPARTDRRQERRSDNQLWNARDLVRADCLLAGDYLLLPLGGAERQFDWNWNNDARKRGIRRKGVSFNPGAEFYRLLGYYAAEGHLQRMNGIAVGVLLSFSAAERDTWVIDAVNCCQNTFGFRPDVGAGPHQSVLQVRIWSTSIAELIERLVIGRAVTKRLAQPLLTAAIRFQRELLLGWLRGDGSLLISERNRVKLLGTSASETLARQMFVIAMRLGLTPSFKVRAGRVFDVYFAAQDAAALGWMVPCRHFRTSRRVVKDHILARVRDIRSFRYDGPVYDIDVDDDNLFAAPFALVHNCDPPYPHAARGDNNAYAFEMSDEEHRELAAVLATVQGKAAVSGYRCDLMDKLYGGWHRFDAPRKNCHSVKKVRQEAVWVNY